MAILQATTLTPSKPELLAEWVPTRPWGAPVAEVLGAYRFDDPDGAVGLETFLVRTEDGQVLQVPLSYRDAPLVAGERYFVRTMQHGVLGERWVYDATGDPVYVRALAAALLAGAPQGEEVFEGTGERREPSVTTTGSGSALRDLPPVDTVVATDEPSVTVIASGALRVVLRRRLDLSAPGSGGQATLTGRWAGQAEPVLLAHVG